MGLLLASKAGAKVCFSPNKSSGRENAVVDVL